MQTPPHFAPDPDPQRYAGDVADTLARYGSAGSPKGRVVFTGSSMVRLWEGLAGDMPGFAVLNHGFGGAQASDFRAFADRLVLAAEPAAILLHVGGNDLGDGKPPAQVLADLDAFFTRARGALPGVHLGFISLQSTPTRAAFAEKIHRVNTEVQKRLTAMGNAGFIDTASTVLGPDGQPDPRFFIEDGVHMNRAGYQQWRPPVHRYLAELATHGGLPDSALSNPPEHADL